MSTHYLLDEHLPTWWRRRIATRAPGLRILYVGDPGAPPHGTPDPVILDWCEAQGAILVTNNRRSMPAHLANHAAQGRHVPGIFIVDPATAVDEVADELALVADASLPDEYQDQIRHLPLSS